MRLCRPLLFGQSKKTPLFWAAYNGHAKTVKFLIECDANVNCEDEVSSSDLNCCQLYLRPGARCVHSISTIGYWYELWRAWRFDF